MAGPKYVWGTEKKPGGGYERVRIRADRARRIRQRMQGPKPGTPPKPGAGPKPGKGPRIIVNPSKNFVRWPGGTARYKLEDGKLQFIGNKQLVPTAVKRAILGHKGQQIRVLPWKAPAKPGGGKPGTTPKPGGGAAPKPAKDPNAGIPLPYQGLVDDTGLDQAVTSVIRGMNAPLRDARGEVRDQMRENVQAGNSIGRQAQQAIQGLASDQARGTGSMLAIAAQMAAADQQGLGDSGRFLAQAFGPAYNAQVAAGMGANFNELSTRANTANVQNAWDVGLTGNLQRDFFNRAQAVAAVTQQAFNQGQRNEASDQLAQIARQIAANRGQAGALRRQFMQQDAEFGLNRQGADRQYGLQLDQAQTQKDQWQSQFDLERQTAEQAFKFDVMSLKAEQLAAEDEARTQAEQTAYDRRQDAIDNKEDRIALELRKQQIENGMGGGSNSTGGRHGFGKAFDSKIDEVRDTVDQIRANLGKPIDKDDPDGPKWGWQYGGPWRDTFMLLKKRGMSPDQAALAASVYEPASVSPSMTSAEGLWELLRNRNVSVPVQRHLIVRNFDLQAWKNLVSFHSGRPVPGTSKPDNSPIHGTVWQRLFKKYKGQSMKANGASWKLVSMGTRNGDVAYVFQSGQGYKAIIKVDGDRKPFDLLKDKFGD